MKHLAFAVALLVHCLAHAAPCLKGVTDKDPLSYAVGEDIVFTVSLEGAESFPDGVSATWRRSGDDGVEEKGTWDGRAPLTVKTKLKRAGFVRLTVEPRQTANGNPWRVKGASGDVFFDGGAGVGVNMLVQSKPEPKDFDAFWKTCRDELDAVPVKADLEEIPSPTKGVRLYKANVTCPGGTGYSTGYLSVPVGAKKVKAAASFFGYQFSWTKGAYMPPSSVPTTEMRFYVSAHGFELGREPTYYQSLREAAGSNGFGHGFDPKQNAKPATCYFHGMALRVMRAVEYLKTRPEWNGRDLVVAGGSQGSLQAMWCAAFVPGVTEAQIFIPWLCDVGGTTDGRNHGDWFPEWAPGLDYFDQVNVAKRIPETCRVAISRIGLGDYIAPPCGAAMMYHSLKCPKSAVWMQGSTHGYVPPTPQTISWNDLSGDRTWSCKVVEQR